MIYAPPASKSRRIISFHLSGNISKQTATPPLLKNLPFEQTGRNGILERRGNIYNTLRYKNLLEKVSFEITFHEIKVYTFSPSHVYRSRYDKSRNIPEAEF